MPLTYKEVSEILKIIDSSNCEEVLLELEGTRLVVRRGDSLSEQLNLNTPPDKSPSIAPSITPSVKKDKSEQMRPQAKITIEEHDDTIVRSPMVGTFYQSPSPEEPPFVEKGCKIKKGDPLCLIEVMKLYTTVESTTAGTIESILITDGTLVEFNQPLFRIKPD